MGPVVMKRTRELVLIEADDPRIVGGEQDAQAHAARDLAIGEMVHDLSRRPLAGPGTRGELLVARANERIRDHTVAVFVLIDQRLPCVSVHITVLITKP